MRGGNEGGKGKIGESKSMARGAVVLMLFAE